MTLNHAAIADLVSLSEGHAKAAGIEVFQTALAHDGRTLLDHRVGGERVRVTGFSVTKAVTAAALWSLVDEGGIEFGDRLDKHLPVFSDHPLGAVTVAQVLTHTSGFPDAVMTPEAWSDPEKRAACFQSWALQWRPGSRFEYHATSGMWVVAALIEARGQQDFRTVVAERVLRPLGMAESQLGGDFTDLTVAPIHHKGPRSGDLKAADIRPPDRLYDEPYYESYNDPAVRRVGVPSSGLVTTAADMARFYQGLLTALRGDGLWSQGLMAEVTRVQTGALVDPIVGRPANRGLGVVVSGDNSRVLRGFGYDCSPRAFGHPGVGGQMAWGDPESGLSFSALTSTLDRHQVRVGLRMSALGSAATRVCSKGGGGGLISRWVSATRRELGNAHFQRDRDFVEKLLPRMELLGRYFDSEVRGMETVPEGPVLLVGNHSGGMLTPDTSAVMAAWYRARGLDEPLVGLAFDAAFGIPGFRDILRKLGLVPASRQNARRALESGHSVLVYPGGAHEVYRPWADRNRIDFNGHQGFIKLALQEGVPIVPVVGHGAHETSVVISRGEWLSELLGLDRLRLKVLPIVFQLPWGVSPGGTPAIPLPAKITVQIGAPISWPELGPEAAGDPAIVQDCYDRVVNTMQEHLDDLAAETPNPLLSRVKRGLRAFAEAK